MNRYTIFWHTNFKKDFKKIQKNNGKYLNRIIQTIRLLKQYGIDGIPIGMRPHQLIGDMKGIWDIHLKGDLVMLLIQINENKEITLIRVGSHAQLVI